MTIEERHKAIFGADLGTEIKNSGEEIDLGTIPPFNGLVLLGGTVALVSLASQPMKAVVLEPHPKSGQDRLQMPDGRVLIGGGINREQITGVSNRRGGFSTEIVSTSNPRPPKPGRRG